MTSRDAPRAPRRRWLKRAALGLIATVLRGALPASSLLGAGRAAAQTVPGAGGATDAGPSAGPPAASNEAAIAPAASEFYPPGLTGLRGSTVGTFEVAHAMRDGQLPATFSDDGERVDLVIVGAGISGLAAAYFFRQQRPGAHILLLDNHDDFGGHARRNEFHLDGRLHVMNGGTLSIQSPRPYSAVAEGLLLAVGIDAKRLERRILKRDFYRSQGMATGFFFDQESFGSDVLMRRDPHVKWAKTLAKAPIDVKAKADIARIESAAIDYLPGLSAQQKKERLSAMSYRDYLVDIAHVHPDVIRYYQQRTHGEYCIGIEAVSALDCWALGLPGFQGLHLAPGAIGRMSPTAAGFADTGGSVDVHLPDGGATVARSLVRALIPEVLPGTGLEDLVGAHANYARLDVDGEPVRIRLNSTVVRVRNEAADAGAAVRIDYVQAGQPRTVHATQCVLACWNMVIPYLCPELPDVQKRALHSLVKCPLVYVSVALRNWEPFRKLGVSQIHCPNSFYSDLWLNEWLHIGAYQTPPPSTEPIIVHLQYTPCAPGENGTDQMRIGRAKLLAISLETFENNVRTQLDAMLGPGGFVAERDILAITVNRWAHGYAYEYDPMLGPPSARGEEPYVVGRQRFGAIAIANSDSGGLAYMDSAIDQAHRAVGDLLAT